VDADTVWLALALVLVLEGLLPFASPAAWRRVATLLLQRRDSQIRGFGFGCMAAGLLLLLLLH
jgi:uncharacterized protein YjeT (DUF2065 family)